MKDIHDQRWKRIFRRDNNQCIYCERSIIKCFEIYHSSTEDHLYPKSCGGASNDENLVTACNLCNSLKGNYKPSIDDDKLLKDGNGKIYIKEEERVKYIEAIRREIKSRKEERQKQYEKHKEGH